MVRRNTHTPDSQSAEAAPRELDSRESDGIQVQLLWHPATGRVSVAVSDHKTGTSFDLVVQSGQRPVDVFHHPFAYAASTSQTVSWGDQSAATAHA